MLQKQQLQTQLVPVRRFSSKYFFIIIPMFYPKSLHCKNLGTGCQVHGNAHGRKNKLLKNVSHRYFTLLHKYFTIIATLLYYIIYFVRVCIIVIFHRTQSRLNEVVIEVVSRVACCLSSSSSYLFLYVSFYYTTGIPGTNTALIKIGSG